MDVVFLIGRVLLAAIFLTSALGHITQSKGMAQYAASKGVPAAEAGVILSGVIALLAGISLVLGIWIDLGALLLVVFLVPVSLFMHPFWTEKDPQAKQNDQIHFFKNLGLLGAALTLLYVASAVADPGLTLTAPLFL